ncbi:hypothetical protein ABZ313_35550 [Streptomyces sp. NPDC006251]|uniref:hypothetical protein n=1 Tax=Streptomyces sp. NPDC006251 TaxID=3155718 RepID=UPI0033BF6288
MPKKRKKDRKHGKRRVPVQVTPAAEAEGLLDEDEWDEYEDDEDRDIFHHFTKDYPTPADAVRAARSGEQVEWHGRIEGGLMRHRVLADEDPVIEQAVFMDGFLASAACCGWIQAQDRAKAERGILTTLTELHSICRPVLEAEIRAARPGYRARHLHAFSEAAVDTPIGFPRFGLRTTYAAREVAVWEQTRDPATWNMALSFASFLGFDEKIPELTRDALTARLQRNGVPVNRCARCGVPLTNRHPRWNGVWTCPIAEIGTLCEVSSDPYENDGVYMFSDGDFGYPHQPAPAI